MLKLKKVQILGFKSFCDRTEVQLTGQGIAAIVGPNGCGKSNISDAITWVLGEQSAKSLRGIKMEDVIFAGTRDRKPTGMAEVSLTLVDPEVYDGATLAEGEAEVFSDGPTLVPMPAGDWDESALREQIAQETEDAVAEAQPGTTYEAEAPVAKKTEGAKAEATQGEPSNNVVLKIRRRKFGRAPIRAGEITVTRRLFRTGDSEYLLNGKICRLSDIKDIFMGTGLGGESYAMIGQERIGQILSSKPLDRRGIIEEAAGITRFKTKKRLAELRLESAKQNLSRVNDIFEEVTRQMAVLKRQAAKAERYGALRDELRGKLRVVLASRLTQMDAEQSATATEIARLAGLIDTQAAELETMDSEHSVGVARGYELDSQIREAGSRANQSAVELERITARSASNADRISDLAQRITSGNDDLEQARAQMASLAGEREQQRSFLENATSESTASRDEANAQQAQAHEATRNVLATEALTENQRRSAMQVMQRANQSRNEQAQAEAALAGLENESERLVGESEAARAELEALSSQRNQIKMSFEGVTERLKKLEADIVELRHTLEARRMEETQSRRRGDELRAEMATLMGRRGSLEALIREHSYSTDTVRNIFRANAKRDQTGGLVPVGTLADFLEVDGQYENVVDEFLRDELNYIVVKSWDAADEGVRMLQSDVAGRATFLVHPNDAQANFPLAEGMLSKALTENSGVVPLRDCIRVLDGFGRSLEVILPKLREGFVAPDSATARSLALSNPQAFFLSPTGETFHNVTVTGGRPRAQGPLALKRELAEVQAKLEGVEAELASNEQATLALTREIAESTSVLDSKNHERRDAERESANSGAALRQMEGETARIERRLQEWQLAAGRNQDTRQQKQDLIARKQEETASFEADRARIEQQIAELTEKIAALRANREELQAAASAAAASLAGLEERRRNANANFEQTNRLYEGQAQRIAQIEQQITSAASEKQRREEETASLSMQHEGLTETRAQALAEVETLTAEASGLRVAMTELDSRLRTLRHETEALREQRAQLSARAAKLTSDLEHLEGTCINDLSVEPATLREDATIERIEAEALHTEDEAARALKQRLEAMGPVNMMALEEYTETSERHGFLETQRKDLLDSIENTQASIKEIDDVSHLKFDEAFKIVNENFSTTFTKLFGGGQAMMKLTDEANSSESGIDIIASPPGKKLQNVLLLSGGEKALTALSLLVGIFQFQPAPFCVLDEVDAPLDETNVGRFARLIAEMSETTQFVVITHSKRTMEQADVMYGVTMQEPGVSKIVSVSLGGRSKGREARTAA
ncbi:chromosome segregation protein SMC [Granulicella mallensis]|uniref:Chromosome partition protein Smc n=1 Tax=Granulicella mallensis (strain ATCC BAA-1857 / DSM 23137 / MP5ACTX8) TaxID=682795 RepID=G8NNZ7_GRAMM|nr:chromosome segregation protein SMC [Granulicella mallensis]AEU37101.1 chromosome segregation protein SMC [Granulicella mallensis MP5ACTX8]